MLLPKKLLLHLLSHHPTFIIFILSIEIPQNLLPYQRDNFVSPKVMDEETTDLQELSIDRGDRTLVKSQSTTF